MKVYKEVVVPAVEAKVVKKLDKVVCDICKKEGIENYNGNKWNKYSYNINNTTIEYSVGNNYGSDGCYEETKYFDICDECFIAKVVPALESLGAVMYVEESDW